ncbi:MAG: hypothetical protein Ta2A_08800 [Treponemataceae bacterium]|nr:MAG: hypothetical protein Ta2A_08800 [Treponemataceae bacterium]
MLVVYKTENGKKEKSKGTRTPSVRRYWTKLMGCYKIILKCVKKNS